MKGFIKILEAIIASIILLTSLTFFFSTQLRESNWGDTLLKIKTDDALAALVKSGDAQQYVRTNDTEGINNALLNPNLAIMPPTIDYSVQVLGIPNPVILVGCDCTQAQIETLQSLLGSLNFNYKERDISIRIAPDKVDNVRNETNVLVIFGYRDLTPSKQKLSRFLERGGTILMIGDLTEAQVNDGYLNETFGLRWVSGSRSNTGTFLEPDNERRASFRINKYYSNLTGSAASFDFTGTATIQNLDERTIVTDGTFSLVKINQEIVNGHGRTVWMADPQSNSETRNMTKAIFMWASGESFKMDVTKKRPLTKNFKSSVLVYDSDPYEIVLTVWEVFQ